MRILLISIQKNLDILGLKGLHHFLLDRGYESHLLYLPTFDTSCSEHVEAVRTFIQTLDPALIGMSVMAIDYGQAVDISAVAREAAPESPLIWGGIHPTTAPEMCLEHADYVCIGEGEHSLVDMAEALQRGESLEAINNLAYLKDGSLHTNPLYPLITDLDTLSIVKQVSPNSVLHEGACVHPVTVAHLEHYKRYKGSVYKILTSRGCPYNCSYCCNHFLRKLYGVWKVRRRSPDHVMRELEEAMARGPRLEYIDFIDDCFLSCDLDYLKEFCKVFKERIGRPFIAKGTPRYFTREKLDLVVDAGMVWANMGLQSGSDRICTEVYRRTIKSEEFIAATRLIHEYPIAAYYDIIVDNPYETLDDTLATAEVLMQAPRPFYVLVFSLTLYYGTDIRKRVMEEHPDYLKETLNVDFLIRDKTLPSMVVEMAPVMHRPILRRLIRLVRSHPEASYTYGIVKLAALYARLILAPISYFRLILRSQKGSWWRTLRVLPVFFQGAFVYYKNAFEAFKRTYNN